MKLNASGKWYREVPIYIHGPHGLVKVPLVLLADGRPGYTINQWIYWLVCEDMAAERLDFHIRALKHLFAFTMARHAGGRLSREDKESLISGFIDAKRYGTDSFCTIDMPHLQYLKSLSIHWEKSSNRNIEAYLAAIDVFDDWQSKFHCAERLNPSEITFMTDWEIYKDYKIRTNYDPLVHLHTAHTHEKKEHSAKAAPKFQHKRFKATVRTAKAFPIGHLLKLFNCARNPRDQLLLLLMFGGSLRMSEPLHILRTDIEPMDEWGQLKVRLVDPRKGNVEWSDNGIMRYAKREDYFREVWANKDLPASHKLRDLRPRDTYLKLDWLQVGWKGMTFGESDGGNVFGIDPMGRNYDVHYVWWLDLRIGARAQQAYEQYRNQCLLRNYHTNELMPKGWLRHPWLFISLDPDDYGAPMSRTSLKALWDRLMERLANDYGVELRGRGLKQWHSLRHFYGWYCASVLKLSLETTSSLMHHASGESTKVYYKISPTTARVELTKKFLEDRGYSAQDTDLIITPDTPKLEFPGDWINPQLQRKLLEMDYQKKLPRRA